MVFWLFLGKWLFKSAGIFLLLRIATVLQWHLTIVTLVAGFTIVFGGTLAVLTPDIKHIIA